MFNKEVLGYCFKGIGLVPGREVIPTLKGAILGYDIACDKLFDSSRYYFIDGVTRNVLMSDSPENRVCLSAEDFLYKLIGEKVDLNWYDNLLEGNQVTFGFCSCLTEEYNFQFNTTYVRKNIGKVVTIQEIKNLRKPFNPSWWYNGDSRAYLIKEFNHWFPSSVFIPQFIKPTPVKCIELSDVFINKLWSL